MSYVWYNKQAVIALYDIHRLDFLMAGRPVLCEVQTASLIMSINFGFQNDKIKNNIIHKIVFKFSFSLSKNSPIDWYFKHPPLSIRLHKNEYQQTAWTVKAEWTVVVKCRQFVNINKYVYRFTLF
jgi:hypothetical protein